ncbi:unnamed protein product [Clonostachys rosea]|uniref:Uncharacterized protein n=1 Tax=Bionectria ochroleuca TaxID=29856 RepID=A0ABY6V2L5_BIOOC|nr:unnamed protein product [Clonostachys rosea]
MGDPGKEKEVAHHREQDGDAPPPYDEPSHDAPPDFEASIAAARASYKRDPITVKFPAKFTCFYHWNSFTFHLGTSKKDLLFAVSPARLWGQKETLLRTGPEKSDPPLATAGTLKGSKQTSSLIKVHPHSGGEHKEILEVTMTGDYENTHRFSVPVGEKQQLEFFEWRNSRGAEVREAADKKTTGYKLVRLSDSDVDRGGSRKEREAGFTSDGRRVVAVAFHTASWMGGPQFAFLCDTLGETFEIVAVMSFLRIYELASQQAATAGAVAAA